MAGAHRKREQLEEALYKAELFGTVLPSGVLQEHNCRERNSGSTAPHIYSMTCSVVLLHLE